MTKKPLFASVACFLLLSTSGHSQDSAWKKRTVTEDLSISIPGNLYEVDSPKVVVTGSHFKGYGLQANYVKKPFEVKNASELMALYDGFIKGYLNAKSVKSYKTTITDTSFGGTTGKWVHSTYSQDSTYEERFTYIVLVNSHFYTIVFFMYKPMNMTSYDMLSRYYSSISFPRPVKEYSGDFHRQVKTYQLGKNIGRYGAMVFILVVVGGLVVVFTRNKKAGA
ncbi:MAG: hypothetical protein JST68_23385 [Bacteroidetes bacterium]|nr:hypothetical protein [Bacteroidota bacterium]